MHRQNESISETLPPAFYVSWNTAADYFHSFQILSTTEEQIAQLNLAKFHFYQAKEHCHSPENIAACNLQLALIIDKKIEIFAQEMIDNNRLRLEEFGDFISLNMEELRHLFFQNENQIFASIHHNIGLQYFLMIDEFDHLDLGISATLGNHAKAQFELARTFAQDEEGMIINQNMIDRVNFDIAALFKYDLTEAMNLHLFSTYFAFFTDALSAYRRNKTLCSKEDMLELTQFTLATINTHYFALARFHIPNLLVTKLPDLKRCLLNLSRSAGNKQDAILWMENYRLIEAHLVCLAESNEPLPAISSNPEGLFPSLLAQNMFGSSTFSGFADVLGQFSQDTQYLLETRDCLFFTNTPKI